MQAPATVPYPGQTALVGLPSGDIDVAALVDRGADDSHQKQDQAPGREPEHQMRKWRGVAGYRGVDSRHHWNAKKRLREEHKYQKRHYINDERITQNRWRCNGIRRFANFRLFLRQRSALAEIRGRGID